MRKHLSVLSERDESSRRQQAPLGLVNAGKTEAKSTAKIRTQFLDSRSESTDRWLRFSTPERQMREISEVVKAKGDE